MNQLPEYVVGQQYIRRVGGGNVSASSSHHVSYSQAPAWLQPRISTFYGESQQTQVGYALTLEGSSDSLTDYVYGRALSHGNIIIAKLEHQDDDGRYFTPVTVEPYSRYGVYGSLFHGLLTVIQIDCYRPWRQRLQWDIYTKGSPYGIPLTRPEKNTEQFVKALALLQNEFSDPEVMPWSWMSSNDSLFLLPPGAEKDFTQKAISLGAYIDKR